MSIEFVTNIEVEGREPPSPLVKYCIRSIVKCINEISENL
jgi:hypothetical protein